VSQVLATVFRPIEDRHCAHCDEVHSDCAMCSWASFAWGTLTWLAPTLVLFIQFYNQDRIVDEFEMVWIYITHYPREPDFHSFLRRVRRVWEFLAKRFIEAWFTGPINERVFAILALCSVPALVVTAGDGHLWPACSRHHGAHVAQLLWFGLAGWVIFGW